MINWELVKPSNFEKFIYYILPKFGFRNREWPGKGGGDRGRDITATRYEELPFNLGYDRKWIFQCKKWKRMPSSTVLYNEISTAAQHQPDFWVLVIPLNPTPNQLDFLNSIEKSYPFKIILFPLAVIEEIIYTFPETKSILIRGLLPNGSEE